VDDAPPTLFARGLWPPPNGRRAAVVGTREPSPEARALAQNLASALVELGYTIVSGLAVGIDQSAHLGALAIPGGYTLGVLGCGVLNIYPPGNIPLAQAVMSHGAVLSEFNPFATPSASNLVARNRVITGLSDAVIVVETDVNGGAMHAARFAAVQGRPVYTFDSAATGNRALLQSGAVALKPDLSDLPF
jgi:DNA processing protein